MDKKSTKGSTCMKGTKGMDVIKSLKRLTGPILAVLVLTGCDERSTSQTAPSAVVTHEAVGARQPAAGCARASVGFTPLTEPGVSPYPNEPLGLYPGGTNQMPSAHLSAGLKMASMVTPLNASGAPDPEGRYALISIGMSNTTQEFSEFIAMSPSPNNKLAIIDGAQGGQTARLWADPNCACWTVLEERIQSAGLTNAQVVAVWVKLANANPSGTWPLAAQALQGDTENVLRLLAARFPKLRLAYLSSRVYAGYAMTTLNPEPYAYEGGLAMRAVIKTQLSGKLPFAGPSRVAPWIAWGPYLWADGLKPRKDGLTWLCSDFESDGTHPSAAGEHKVAEQLVQFFTTDPTTRSWFMTAPAGSPGP